jgi:chromosome segregation ATPase
MTTEDRITQLEDQLHDLQGQQADLRKQLAKAQLDQWQGRVEDLEVQMHLGAVQASDKANAQMKKLRDKWADARRQFEDSIKTATSVADTVRTGLENALDDLRKALLESKSKLTSSAGRLPSRRPASPGR